MITNNFKLIIFLIGLSIYTIITTSFYSVFRENKITETVVIDRSDKNSIFGSIDDYLDFEGFDNINGSDKYIVPNIVHLLYLQHTEMKFYELINIFSIFLNHKPSLIYIHCDNCSFHGKYWEVIQSNQDLWKIIKVHKIPFNPTIFGVKYGWINHHRSDIWRLQVLMNYGGIYLDNDVYVINSLHEYRKYEMTVSWDDENDGIGVQVIIAHKNARFLKTHFDSYRYNYTSSQWYWNAGFFPAKILLKHRYLVHVVKEKLGTHMLIHKLFYTHWKEWRTYDSCHLLINHRSYLDKESPIKEFNETNIRDYNKTYGFMVRDIIEKANLKFDPKTAKN